ncbi:hypothetical protein AB4865_07160 [Capnocytophaga sp. ARDL2]|uniref:hypothetical protein n=1 Tax=Capnocytophaga sp. ARDL2 TaxID=3238809 RepID=UPI00355704C8
MIGNTFINTPLAIEQSYFMALIPTLLSEYALVQRAVSISAEEKEQKYLSTIQGMNTRAEGAMYPVVISIVGPIIKYSSWACLGTSFYADLLKSLDSNPQVLGIVLNIDSGGGMVSGIAELTDTIKNLAKPTIAYTSGYMCSYKLWKPLVWKHKKVSKKTFCCWLPNAKNMAMHKTAILFQKTTAKTSLPMGCCTAT